MRDPKRIDKVLKELKKVWKLNPDLRLGQLIYNVAKKYGYGGEDLFYTEDDTLLKGLEEWSKQIKKDIKDEKD